MKHENKVINCHFKINEEIFYGKITNRNGIFYVLELPRKIFEEPPNQFVCYSETNEVILLDKLVHEEISFQQILFFENMIMGFYCKEESLDLKFKSINFDFPYINAFFFGLDEITNGCEEHGNNLCLYYENTNKKIHYKYNDDFTIEVIHGCQTSHTRFGTGKSKMELHKHLKIKSKKNRELHEFIIVINNLMKFFSFALKRKLLITNIWSEGKENSSNQKLKISTFQYKILNTNFEEEIDIWKMLVGYRYFSPNKMSKIIQRFTNLINQEYRKFSAIIDLYLRNQDAPAEIYSQVEFLIYTTALEAYVSSKDYNKIRKIDAEYESLVNKIKQEYPNIDELKKIPNRQYSFAEKINNCIEQEDIHGIFKFYYKGKDKIKIISDIVNLRNYFTHYSFSADDSCINNIDMNTLKDDLKILLETFILHELQIKNEDIKKIVTNNTFKMHNFNNEYMWVPHIRYKTNIPIRNYLGQEFFAPNIDDMPMDLDLYYKEIDDKNVQLIGKYKRNNRLCTITIDVLKKISQKQIDKLPKYFQECYRRYKIAETQNIYYYNN